MSYRQKSIGKIVDFLPTVDLDNVEESLLKIRQAAKEYYARKNGTWKPKRDLDAERLEDEARFRREAFMSVPWIDRHPSGIVKMLSTRPRVDYEITERLRKAFSYFDMMALEERVKETLTKMREYPADKIIVDEVSTISPITVSVRDLKEYHHKFLYGEWSEPTAKIGEGKNPMAEHTIRAVKKSHAKRRFSKKSQRGIL